MSIYFSLHKILLMEKVSIPLKTGKGTWKSSLLKKVRSFGKTELWSCLKNCWRQWNKALNTLFNKVLGEKWKMCLLFFFKKPKELFGPPNISSDHFWIWVLDHKKSWAPVNRKENQSWVFIGMTDAEAEAPMFWSPDATNWLLRKDPDDGKDWRQEKGMTGDEMVGRHHRMNMSLSC